MSALSARPSAVGVGFKPVHYPELVGGQSAISFIEIHAENYMGPGGAPHAQLARLRADYPISVHGVGLSIGSSEALDRSQLARLKTLIDRYAPILVSEHLAWSSYNGVYFGDLLPLPYTKRTLDLVVDRVAETQEALGRAILLENPARYFAFEESEISEGEFISEIARRSGCGLLLDVTNAYISAFNLGLDASAYVTALPLTKVREVHLAGYANGVDTTGAPVFIDAHDRAIPNGVWSLFDEVISQTGPLPTLVEWDNNVPEWRSLLAETLKASRILCDHGAARHVRPFLNERNHVA